MTPREIDALVATKIMGWKLGEPGSGCGDRKCGCMDTGPDLASSYRYIKGTLCRGESHNDWTPSTRVEDAWEVVEKMARDGWHIQISLLGADWDCYFAGKGRHPDDMRTWAKTAPLAICLAALKAVGVSA